jgi:hypothetical protein
MGHRRLSYITDPFLFDGRVIIETMKTFSANSCTKAWLETAQHLRTRPHWRDYNVILEITDPMSMPPEDKRVHDIVDEFLNAKAGKRISTIVNTIFPATLYKNYGRDGVFKRFPEMWPTIEKHPDIKWGTYFRRMTNRTQSGKPDINPLERLIDKLKVQSKSRSPKHAAYEVGIHELDEDLPLYDPRTDAGRTMGGPCLSHLSFKLKDDHALMLTGFYRSHHYIHRALGNLLGLAWLQHFVASEVQVPTAELVCISSMATLDTSDWTKSNVTVLLDNCLSASTVGSPQDQSLATAIT